MNCENIIRAIQYRLKGLGYYQGFIDGLTGPMTSNAIISFKTDNGLMSRDFIGPVTLTKLFDQKAKSKPKPKPADNKKTPPWIIEAYSLVGTKELSGSKNNPVIMNWAKDLDQWYPGDDVPWCGLFMAHCMSIGAPEEVQDFNRLGARNWLEYGSEASKWYGSIAVFWRTHQTKSWNGHVGFLIGQDKETYHILGGNQNNSVNVTRISKTRLLGFRCPVGWKGEANLKAASKAKISTNEG